MSFLCFFFWVKWHFWLIWGSLQTSGFPLPLALFCPSRVWLPSPLPSVFIIIFVSRKVWPPCVRLATPDFQCVFLSFLRPSPPAGVGMCDWGLLFLLFFFGFFPKYCDLFGFFAPGLPLPFCCPSPQSFLFFFVCPSRHPTVLILIKISSLWFASSCSLDPFPIQTPSS